MPTITLDGRGRLLITQELRARLGVRPGDAVDVQVDEGELRVRRSVDPYGHLTPQALMAEYVRWAGEHPDVVAAINAEMTDWENISSELPDEEWTDADFVPEAR